MQRTIGTTRITSVPEQALTGIEHLLRAALPDAVATIPWMRPHFVDDDGLMLGLIQMFVIEHDDQVIVVDTCVGNGKDLPVREEWSGLHTDFLGRFRRAGFDPGDVDVVLCTHLHLDHVGWNTYLDDDVWRPTFPNARHLFDRTEYRFWQGEASTPYVARPGDSERMTAMREEFRRTQRNVLHESVQPIVDAGLVELVDAPCEPIPGIRLVPTPGHTPGHVSIQITSGSARALVTGDSFHHPCQIARPDWAAAVDHDRAESTATRQRMLEDVVGTDVLFVGTHFAEPVCGHVVADGDTYRLVAGGDSDRLAVDADLR